MLEKRGLLRSHKGEGLFFMNILFVCTGNTCRSPMAAGIFKKIVKEKKLKNVEISSAGIAANNTSPATKNAIEVCQNIDIDIREHISRSVFDVNLYAIDKFVVMTKSHRDALLKLRVNSDKIYILNGEIVDPFGGDLTAYEACRDKIYAVLDQLAETWCTQ